MFKSEEGLLFLCDHHYVCLMSAVKRHIMTQEESDNIAKEFKRQCPKCETSEPQ